MKDVMALLRTGGALAYLVLALYVLPVLARGLFALKRSGSQERKEFLELWKDGDKSDDFWLELMVRHCFGEALPAVLVRRVVCLLAAPSKLSDLARSWSRFTYDTKTGRLEWKSKLRGMWKWGVIELRFFQVLYLVLGTFGLLSVWVWPALSNNKLHTGLVYLLGAAMTLFYLVSLELANAAFKELSPLLAHIESTSVVPMQQGGNEMKTVAR
jgi:hypothetical protein